jgi:histidinol dehydrogenase
MRIIDSSDVPAVGALLEGSRIDLRRATAVVTEIVEDVRRRGDVAVLEWMRKLDAGDAIASAEGLALTEEQIHEGYEKTPDAVKRALHQAAENIATFASRQIPQPWSMRPQPGVRVGQIVRPLQSVGCYVPAGRHPLPSTLLMTVVPASVAGVQRIVVACPHPGPEVLAAAHLCGVTELYRMGGAQAIAALAYGTETVARVEKIVGPGNVYVTAAKHLVSADCGIDFLAGPTEVLIVARGDENPRWLAADLLAQSEHDPHAAAWLLTPSLPLAERVAAAVDELLAEGAAAGAEWVKVARASIESRGAIVLTHDLSEAMELANRIAPEHITVPVSLLKDVRSAGSVFVGEYAPQAVGEYMSGTNHVLPTAALARLRGGLSAADFVKLISVQRLTRSGLELLAPAITALARAEGLEAHARSIEIRRAEPKKARRAEEGNARPYIH